jgi:hypothetical protein
MNHIIFIFYFVIMFNHTISAKEIDFFRLKFKIREFLSL